MNFRDMMQDPYFMGITFSVEKAIHWADRSGERAPAGSAKDSDAKSAIRKALSAL